MINSNDIQFTNKNEIIKQVSGLLKDVPTYKEFKKYWNIEYEYTASIKKRKEILNSSSDGDSYIESDQEDNSDSNQVYITSNGKKKKISKLKDYVELFVSEKLFKSNSIIQGITFKLIAEIDLIGLKSNLKRRNRKWGTFKIEYKNEIRSGYIANVISNKLQAELLPFCQNYIFSIVDNEALWIRILFKHVNSSSNNNISNNSNYSINNSNKINSNSSNNVDSMKSTHSIVYLKHNLNSDYYFISNNSRIGIEFLLQSLSLVFNYKTIENYNLTENSLDSIENYLYSNNISNNINNNNNSKSLVENPLLTIPSLKKRNYELVLKSSDRLQSAKDEEQEEWNLRNQITDNLDMNLNLSLEKKLINSNDNNKINNNNNNNNLNNNNKIINFSLYNNINNNNSSINNISNDNPISSNHFNQKRKLEINFNTVLKSETINKELKTLQVNKNSNNTTTSTPSYSLLKNNPIQFNLVFEGENPVKGIEKLMSMNVIKKPYPSYLTSSIFKKNSITINEFSDSEDDEDFEYDSG